MLAEQSKGSHYGFRDANRKAMSNDAAMAVGFRWAFMEAFFVIFRSVFVPFSFRFCSVFVPFSFSFCSVFV